MPRRTSTSARTPTSTSSSSSRACPSTGASRAPRWRRASTCSSRSPWRPRCADGRGRARPPPRRRPGMLVCAPHILLSPDLPRDARARAGRRDRRAADRARALRLGRPATGAAGSTSPAAARCSTSASTTSPACAGSSARRSRVTAMTGVAIPERIVDGERDARAGRGQRARADRLRRRALRGRHHRLHDAALPLARRSSSTGRTACCRCSATTGRRRATSCGATTRVRGSSTRRPTRTWPWTDGLRHLVECIETGTQPVTRPEHAYHALEIMLAAQAAGADGRAREIRSATSPRRSWTASPRDGSPTSASTTRGAPL